jgi:hypothetical protein
MLEQVFGDWRSLAKAGKGFVDEKKRYDWGIQASSDVEDLGNTDRLWSCGILNLKRYATLVTVMVVLVYYDQGAGQVIARYSVAHHSLSLRQRSNTECSSDALWARTTRKLITILLNELSFGRLTGRWAMLSTNKHAFGGGQSITKKGNEY